MPFIGAEIFTFPCASTRGVLGSFSGDDERSGIAGGFMDIRFILFRFSCSGERPTVAR